MIRHRFKLLASLFLAVGMSGCAVSTDRFGNTQADFDTLDIFAKKLEVIKLHDGADLILREYKGRYSLKVDGRAVVVHFEDIYGFGRTSVTSAPPPKIEAMKFGPVHHLADQTLVVVYASDLICARTTSIHAFKGREALHWQSPAFGCPESVTTRNLPNGKVGVIFNQRPGYGSTPRYEFDGKSLIPATTAWR